MKKLITILATVVIGLSSCSKKDVKPNYPKVTYKFYNSRVPYTVVFYSTVKNEVEVKSKSYEVTVDFDKYYINYVNGVRAIVGDTSKTEMSSEGKYASTPFVVSRGNGLVGVNHNALR